MALFSGLGFKYASGTMRGMKPVVIRSFPRNVATALMCAGVAFVNIPIGPIRNVTPRDGGGWFLFALSAILTAGFLILGYQAARAGVTVDDNAITVRGIGQRTVTVTWDELAKIDCNRTGTWTFGPWLTRRDGSPVTVLALSTWSRKDAERWTQQLRDLALSVGWVA